MRIKSIKIRVTEDELLTLKTLCPKAELATWIRERCLAPSAIEKVKMMKADPDLLRQLAFLGNNLNQLTRKVNSSGLSPLDQIHILSPLVVISEALDKLKHDC